MSDTDFDQLIRKHMASIFEMGRLAGMSETLQEVTALAKGEGPLFEWCAWKNQQVRTEIKRVTGGEV